MNHQIEVVHCKANENNYYVGRPNVLGNPFTHKSNTKADYIVETREIAVTKYKEYIIEKIREKDKAVLAELRRLKNEYLTKGELFLGCWCYPAACHGDVLKAILIKALIEMDRRKNENIKKYSIINGFQYISFDNDTISFTDSVNKFDHVRENTNKKDMENVPLFVGDTVEFLLPSKKDDTIYGTIVKEDNEFFVKVNSRLLNIDEVKITNCSEWLKLVA